MHWLLIFGVAVLMGMGVGGGGLLVICLVLLGGVEQLTAQGINLVFFVVCAASSMLVHLRRRKIRKSLLWGIIPGSIAAYFSAGWAEKLPTDILRMLFGILLCVCGVCGLVTTFFGGRRAKSKKKSESGENGRNLR
ncbi:MAG: sulfite exporter TauE/SafE family protein [Clostridia bacterium]|nr:sulfite exporter TauE/SafE family protein [Clostridia bacterium]